jgi:hypothetical protein
MLFKDRSLAIQKLNTLEQEYPVEHWKINGIHLWPVLKRELFFSEFLKTQVFHAKKGRPPFISRAFGAFIRTASAYLKLVTLRLKPSVFVFAGTPSHRVKWDGKAYNRYFDPIITYLSSKNVNSYLTEYHGINRATIFHKGNFIDCAILFHAFKKDHHLKADWQRLADDPQFQQFLVALQSRFPVYAKDLEKNMLSVLNKISSWRNLYVYLFQRIGPEYAVGLCYYSYAIYGMNVAASDLGIISVDMQHGGQGALHPAYTFKKIPDKGYNTLPKEFWCWDEVSYAHIEGWSAGRAHRAKLIGNPWYAFLKEKALTFDGNFPKDKALILFSHQPLVPALDLYLMESIQQTKDLYHWWIRLHPRITKAEEEALVGLLKEHGIFEDVELHKSTHLPLPIILNQSAVHLSKYSGTIIESVMMGVPTIILEGVGNHSFAQIIKEGKAIGLPDPTTETLKACLARVVKAPRKAIEALDFKQFINNCLAKV